MTAVLDRVVEDETLVEEDPTVECEGCTERFPEGDLTEVKSGGLVCDDCVAADFTTCDDCDDVTPDGDITKVSGYRDVCEDCLDNNYGACARCGDHERHEDLYSVYDGDDYVCQSCIDHHYFYCDYCDTRVADTDPDHAHDTDASSGCCESPLPSQTFTMPNGAVQDEVFDVVLPDGLITAAGLNEMRELCYRTIPWDDYVLRDRIITALYNVGLEYVNKDGKFQKRVSKYLHKTWATKAPEDLISKIGQAAQRASVGGTKRVAFTRQLNLSAEEFYHEDSCWWSDYSYSRCTLKSNGGFGMRTFADDAWGSVTGRAWVFPLKRNEIGRLMPTFDTVGADAFIVFNGYGELSETEQARVLAATHEGWVSKRVEFYPGNMYVNAGGFLVGPADVLEDAVASFSLEKHSDLWNIENNESKAAA